MTKNKIHPENLNVHYFIEYVTGKKAPETFLEHSHETMTISIMYNYFSDKVLKTIPDF